ncbi:MAG: signal peptidase I [Oscillospiraceae bacterium]|nr:signal peptidase I [Oscillospiraceae bacterium]
MKKILNNIITVISCIILVFALIVTVIVFSADRNNGVADLFGYVPLTVESDSMSPVFAKDDLIIDKEIDDVYQLENGDVITFWTLINGHRVKNTHRIISVNDADGNINFTTKGDNNDIRDSINVYPVDIIGEWTGIKFGGFGKVMNFLRTKTGFFICIIIPMTLFFLFELYKLIVVIVEIKRPPVPQIDEEEIRKRAVEEYIAEQQRKNETQPDKKNDE